MTAVSEPIESGSREPFAAEDLSPVFKWQVGGHDQTVAFIRRADHVEQQF